MTECHERKYLLQIIRQVHLELCKVSKTICTIFGIQIASEIGMIIMILTRALYNLYNRYIIQHKVNTDNLLKQTVVTITLSIFYILKIAYLSRICKHAADKIHQFGIQILQSPVRFSAYGISLDNYVWLTMILKTVTTYLVIMIQMSNSLESNEAIQNNINFK
ncbi:uncharacterized protein LOC112638459 isoform X2 [Camponotus floridanus]|uniref:uncharacterized protein LOC112638459 isoform X2 n=1 Tax=Camponotus floridanus TaxID=104421 RepID=UPI000DC6A108|nr:uncharacterized protein LOC112638459 isoform X2 [Camponotus floridanus]